MKNECELYKYNKCFYLIKNDGLDYFAADFLDTELDDDHVCWLNIHDISDQSAVKQLCSKLHIDKLSIENIYIHQRRPKVEEYPNYIYFSVTLTDLNDGKNDLFGEQQITFFLGETYLITMQNGLKGYFNNVRDRIEFSKGKIRRQKSDFLLYRCMEAILDNYYQIIDDVSENSTKIEKRLHQHEDKSLLHDIETQKRKLIELRTIARPMRDITEQLYSSETSLIQEDNMRYFKTLNSNCSNLITEIDSQIQILDGLANFYYAAQGQRMNEIMKVLTIVSAIFIPLTFIAGVYGMNFENMPELKMKNAYFVVIGSMLILGIILFLYFIWKGWLKKSDYHIDNL
ncbi:MAG: magnesium/cobalt transporter CorA [Flavobacteriales bacterium]